MGKEIFFKKDLPTVLDNVQAAQSTIDSEVDDIVAEVTTKGMIAMQLAMGDGSGKHHEKVLKEAKQLITNLIAQEANKARLDELKNLPDNPDHIMVYVIARLQELRILTADKEQTP